MKMYVYFFHVQTVFTNERYNYYGIYQSDEKIIGGNSFVKFLEYIKKTFEVPFILTNEKLIIRSLSFLHEVEA